MKKNSLWVMLILICTLVACQKPANPPKKADVSPTPVPIQTNAFYQKMTSSNVRPVAVMVDNDDRNALPHAGLHDAYMIYEITVEGGATRLMALFKDTNTAKIGPIRSSRHYFLDYFMEHDALYIHYGFSPKASADLNAFKIQRMNGIYDSGNFWREPKRKNDWHDAYTSIENFQKFAATKSFRMTTDVKPPIQFSPNDVPINSEKPATQISVPFSNFYNCSYTYDASSGLYNRLQDKKAHVSPDGKQYTAKNIILQTVKNYPLGDKDNADRQQLDTVGKGSGTYISGGKCIAIKWQKEGRTQPTVYTLETGEPLIVNPGQTWVEIVPAYSTATIQ